MSPIASDRTTVEFAEWVEPSLLAMTRLALRLAPASDAPDVVQDSLLRAWSNWHRFDATKGTPTTWLLAITADRCRSAWRSRTRRTRFIDETSELPDRAPPSVDPAADVDLARALDRLAPRQRLAVECHYFVGLSIEETAAVMSCRPGTVKSTLHDARQRLRPLIGDDDVHHR